MKKKNIILIALTVIALIIISSLIILVLSNNKPKEKINEDAKRFSKEYTEIEKNNVFVYRSIDKIINILKNGTGIVYLGFPECPWCQTYVKYLNDVAKDSAIEKIYYYNIRQDRNDNTEEYQEIVSILKDYLQNDEEGNKRIYVPSLIAVKKGEIVGFDDETAWDTKGFKTPAEYWTKDEVTDLKAKLEKMIADTGINMCTECE